METEFIAHLVLELGRYAAGKWGLFGRNGNLLQETASPMLNRRLRYSPAQRLIKLGQEIIVVRQELCNPEEFEPYACYLEYRSLRSSNTPGEPKLAAQLLTDLNIKHR